MLQTLQRIGKVAPMNTTGVGKVLLMDRPAAGIDELIASRGLPKPTRNSIGSKRGLVQELSRIREQGFATDDEECELGVRCVAAPLRDYTGGVVAAISTSAPVGRMTPERIKKISKEFIAVAARISQQLGYSGE